MSHRLLFDQNLAPRLVALLTNQFPGSLHALDLGLGHALDIEILDLAEQRDLVIVTKDKDFADIVTARGRGPKVLWLQLGNVSTSDVAGALLESASSIAELLDDPSVRIVQLTRARRD